MGIQILLRHLSIFITDGKSFRISLLFNKFFPLNLCNFTYMFWHQTLLHVICIQFRLPLTKQPSHINKHCILHNILYTSWKLDFFLHIAPNLILYDRRHLPPIYDGNWDIVSNLKSGSMFECFPCFRGFRWEPILCLLLETSSGYVADGPDCLGWGARSHLAQDCEPTN
jgi:hypothetical protein